jgi:Beta-lactamase enzyme family
MALSSAQLQKIADVVFLLRTPQPVPLPKPVNTDAAFTERFEDDVGGNPEFANVGIGVIDFTADVQNPNIWLHNGDEAWPIWSTCKICILLAAVQLRDDVRKAAATGVATTPQDFDDGFKNVWKLSKSPTIAAIRKVPPRISTLFDLDPNPDLIDFAGGATDLDPDDIISRLPADGELTWKISANFTFHERLWLAGANSDNVAAGACISEIGLPYIQSVMTAYGLFDRHRGMRLLLQGFYGWKGLKALAPNFPKVTSAANSPQYRPIPPVSTQLVHDPLTGKPDAFRSDLGGSASAMTAYMVALMQDKLVDEEACDSIRSYLADGSPQTTTSFVSEGVKLRTPIVLQHTKVGFVGDSDADFAYMETPAPKRFNFAIVTAGLRPTKVAGVTVKDLDQAHDLGEKIFDQLSAP